MKSFVPEGTAQNSPAFQSKRRVCGSKVKFRRDGLNTQTVQSSLWDLCVGGRNPALKLKRRAARPRGDSSLPGKFSEDSAPVPSILVVATGADEMEDDATDTILGQQNLHKSLILFLVVFFWFHGVDTGNTIGGRKLAVRRLLRRDATAAD